MDDLVLRTALRAGMRRHPYLRWNAASTNSARSAYFSCVGL